MDNEQIIKDIRDIEDFTDSYWLPMLKRAESETHKDIIRGIIETRTDYVEKLRTYLTPLNN